MVLLWCCRDAAVLLLLCCCAAPVDPSKSVYHQKRLYIPHIFTFYALTFSAAITAALTNEIAETLPALVVMPLPSMLSPMARLDACFWSR